jgi:peptidoglycan/LPS O-acetylase OafA/YrhL
MTYSRSLDGLRGVAILLVLFFHYDFILGCGWIGVELFFVLSGFLITTILLKEKEQPLAYYLKRFYWRRTLRIFPLYYLYLILVGILFILSNVPEDFRTMAPYLATYTFNFYPLAHVYYIKDTFFMHFWSLSVEEQFYFIWPLVIFLCNRKQLQWVLLGIIFVAPVTRMVMAEILLKNGYSQFDAGETVYRFTLSQLDGFAFGAIIPVFSLAKKSFRPGRLILFLLAILLGLGAWNLYVLAANHVPFNYSSLGYELGSLVNYQHVWSYTLLDLLFFLLIAFIIIPQTSSGPVPERGAIIDQILGNKVLVYCGKISYGLYVYHFIIWMTFNKYLKDWFAFKGLAFAVYFMMCMLVASLSYYLFERRILMLKDKYFTSQKSAINEKNSTAI